MLFPGCSQRWMLWASRPGCRRPSRCGRSRSRTFGGARSGTLSGAASSSSAREPATRSSPPTQPPRCEPRRSTQTSSSRCEAGGHEVSGFRAYIGAYSGAGCDTHVSEILPEVHDVACALRVCVWCGKGHKLQLLEPANPPHAAHHCAFLSIHAQHTVIVMEPCIIMAGAEWIPRASPGGMGCPNLARGGSQCLC